MANNNKAPAKQVTGKKKKVKCDQVKIIFIPQYDKLTIETILD